MNSLTLLHARGEYVNELGKARHLLRLGVRDPQLALETPLRHRHLFDRAMGVAPQHQDIPITDFDPWDNTRAAANSPNISNG
jgi:hypothetical protein